MRFLCRRINHQAILVSVFNIRLNQIRPLIGLNVTFTEGALGNFIVGGGGVTLAHCCCSIARLMASTWPSVPVCLIKPVCISSERLSCWAITLMGIFR